MISLTFGNINRLFVLPFKNGHNDPMNVFCYKYYILLKFLVPLHTLSSIEIIKYFNYEPRFNGVISRDNLPRIKDRVHVINLDVNKLNKRHRVSLFIDKTTTVFGIEYIPQEVLNKIKYKSITQNVFKIQDDDSIICEFYCIAFIEYMLAGKVLSGYTILFSPDYYKKNDKIIHKYFKGKA